jgi:NAD(P)-dependent dehydrogenase (short-subunit alcohol dehydrogenase family)
MTQMSDPLDIFGLAGHHALISGGGSGLGLAIAECFVAAGARVTLLGTNADKLAKASAGLGKAADHVVFDITRFDEAADFAARLEAEKGPISILVNNAGTTIKKPMAAMSPADFAAVMDVHVGGAYALSHAFLSQLVARKGSILFTASMSSFLGIPNVIGYSAAKSAYVGMVRAMATELAPQGVRVNGVAPGWIDTALFRSATAADPARRQKIDARIPMQRLGSGADVGWAMTYLASRAAGYVTGHVLVVDGGALHAF